MDHITGEIGEHILDYIIHQYGKEKIHTPSDIIRAVEYDDVLDELKDRLWDLIKYELDFSAIFDEIEKVKEQEARDEEIEEEDEKTEISDEECE